MEYTSPVGESNSHILVMMYTDDVYKCTSNYHVITTTTTPSQIVAFQPFEQIVTQLIYLCFA